DLDIVTAPAERTGLADASADAVVSTLVLCTVSDPEAVLAEVRRVLRPGGRFLFVEHVAAPAGTATRAVQRAVRRPWSWIFEGCDTIRPTGDTLRAARFSEVATRTHAVRSLFVPVNRLVYGTATR
nr:class I SAM-dependent methyltransferase [Micromonospora sp. DSM 115978]